MSQSRNHFSQFPPHSQYKHLVLEKYFEVWGRKLLLRQGAGTSVCFVDACAGRGKDDIGNHGSPIIAATAAADAEKQLEAILGHPVRIQVIAIEKKVSHFKALQTNLAPFGDRARVLQGTLAQHLPDIEREFVDAPALYFVDPFGLEPLQADLIRRALSGGHNEALLRFADQAALRHFGAAFAEETRAERQYRKLEGPSLFPECDQKERARLALKVAKSRESQEITRVRAVEILNAAFGGTSWQATLEQTPQAERRKTLLGLYEAFLETCGARRILLIPVLNQDGGHVYHLIHATKNDKGYVAMKEAVEFALKNGPLPPSVVDGMRFHMRCDLSVVERQVRAKFAGQTVRWTRDKEDRNALSVRDFILEETRAFPSELKALQVRLRNLKLSGRKIVYVFPPTSPPI